MTLLQGGLPIWLASSVHAGVHRESSAGWKEEGGISIGSFVCKRWRKDVVGCLLFDPSRTTLVASQCDQVSPSAVPCGCTSDWPVQALICDDGGSFSYRLEERK